MTKLELSKRERFQVTSKLPRSGRLILGHWRLISDCWASRSEGTKTERAATHMWYSRLIADDGDRQRRRPGRNNQRGTCTFMVFGSGDNGEWPQQTSLYCTRWGSSSHADYPEGLLKKNVRGLKVNVHTLDIAPLRSESPPLKRSGMARVLHAQPHVHPQSEWAIHAFAFPAITGTHLPEGWKAE